MPPKTPDDMLHNRLVREKRRRRVLYSRSRYSNIEYRYRSRLSGTFAYICLHLLAIACKCVQIPASRQAELDICFFSPSGTGDAPKLKFAGTRVRQSHKGALYLPTPTYQEHR